MDYKLKIKEIINYLGSDTQYQGNFTISGISYDSREVKDGDIFVCLIGEKTDGHNFVKDAEAKGAKAILASKNISTKLPVIYVKDTQIAISKLANFFYKEPSKKLRIIGVTGTNGKTTTTHLIQHILEKNSMKCALIGTLGTKESIDGNYYDSKHTTPQAPELQKQLASLQEKGFAYIAMEVSSHALSLYRVHECNFSTAVLTNITQDHLDFHLTMDEYAHAKRKLFEMVNGSSQKNQKNKYTVINKDDSWFSDFSKTINKEMKQVSYGIENKADFQAKEINYKSSGISFKLICPDGEYLVKSKLNGLFNVYNILASISVAHCEGIKINKIIDAISDSREVSGRFQIIFSEQNPDSPLCIVDYAHTPDGLKNILNAARMMTPKQNKLICVFGCGGDRDPTKRPKMGKIVEELADLSIVTSDNPRQEDPKQIISDILSGIKNTSNTIVEPDRKEAIQIAVKKATKNDVVVVAGKGHEDYQILKDKTIHFDDREEVKKALEGIKC